MANGVKFIVCLLISASFFVALKYKFLDIYMTSDKDKASCEANNSDSDSCTIWYSDYNLCLKGNLDENGNCQQKNLAIPIVIIVLGAFFGLLSLFALTE